MTVAVAHQVSSTSRIALTEAARQASLRKTDLAVLHVVESLDLDIAAANRSGIADEVDRALTEAGLDHLDWELHLVTGEDNVADALLGLVETLGVEVLVIGARRRSPVGKFLLGSVTQTLILRADVPVLVVKDKG